MHRLRANDPDKCYESGGDKVSKGNSYRWKSIVEYDASQADTSEIRAAITGAGYRVSSFSGLTVSETK